MISFDKEKGFAEVLAVFAQYSSECTFCFNDRDERFHNRFLSMLVLPMLFGLFKFMNEMART